MCLDLTLDSVFVPLLLKRTLWVFVDCKLKLKGWVKDLMIGVFVKAVYWLSANAYKTSYWCLISLQTLAPVWVFP